MNGTTLALMSMEATPGYPAPEIACMVVTITRLNAERFQRRQSHHQHHGGAVRIGDNLPLPAAMLLLPGDQLQMIRVDFRHQQGTSPSMRWLREFDTMMWPAEANACSISVATDASMAEKTSFGAPSGLDSETTMSRTYAGVSPPSRHTVAS